MSPLLRLRRVADPKSSKTQSAQAPPGLRSACIMHDLPNSQARGDERLSVEQSHDHAPVPPPAHTKVSARASGRSHDFPKPLGKSITKSYNYS